MNDDDADWDLSLLDWLVIVVLAMVIAILLRS